MCSSLTRYLSSRLSYPITRVHLSILDFQTGKRPKVLSLFNFAGSGVPLSADTKSTIVNSDQTDSRRDCLLQNAGAIPRTAFAPTALKLKGVQDAKPARRISNPARCIPIAQRYRGW
ncbi:hypothetical protein J5I95_12415 [Candidatus Poribacteria bacterium]|nr:hypothetical protein [Candidatus Poribacteria bacterium]